MGDRRRRLVIVAAGLVLGLGAGRLATGPSAAIVHAEPIRAA